MDSSELALDLLESLPAEKSAMKEEMCSTLTEPSGMPSDSRGFSPFLNFTTAAAEALGSAAGMDGMAGLTDAWLVAGDGGLVRTDE